MKVQTINILRFALIVFSAAEALGQNRNEGALKDEEIDIVKQKEIVLPPANRIFSKIPAPKQAQTDKKVNYDFVERALNLPPSKFTPGFTQYQPSTVQVVTGYDNYVRAGAGNFGRILGELYLNADNENNTVLSLHAKHNSASQGPVDGKNSANNEQNVLLEGKYLGGNFKLDGGLGFDRNQYYFYGYRQRPSVAVERKDIEQILNKYTFKVGIENTNQEATIDYSLKTKVSYLKDKLEASEMDWGTNFKSAFVINDQFAALLSADAYVTQRTDGIEDKRNLFRVKPTFQFKNGFLTVSAGINAVAEVDKRKNLNRTKGYPIVQIDVMPVDGIHVFGGYEGDMQRNTLTQFLSENRWLAAQVDLRNTEKIRDIYVGSKGSLGSGFNYELRGSLSQQNNFYAINNAQSDTSKFVVLYDSLNINVTSITGTINYQYGELWRSNLKLEFNSFGTKSLENAWHRPTFLATWSNSLIFRKKLFISTDFYLIGGMEGKNLITNKIVKLDPIIDLNTKFTYLLTDQISAFVSLNNLLGKNYQRYTYYQQQGLNFLLGLSFSF